MLKQGCKESSRTERWFHKKSTKYIPMVEDIVEYCNGKHWKTFNPYWFTHESKQIRRKLQRALRRNNKIKIKNGLEPELKYKTCGWETY